MYVYVCNLSQIKARLQVAHFHLTTTEGHVGSGPAASQFMHEVATQKPVSTFPKNHTISLRCKYLALGIMLL